MAKLRPIPREGNIVAYASSLAHELFDGVTRDTGLPYTQGHLAQVAFLVESVVVSSAYKKAAVAAAWLHDSAEDIKGFDVFDPFAACHVRKPDTTYLNDLLTNAGEQGRKVCALVDHMTHREGTSYQEYVSRVFAFPQTHGERYDLHVLAAVLKMADRRANINHDARRDVNGLVEKYIKLAGAPTDDDLVAFYSETKTTDAFREKGSWDLDVALFVQTLTSTFRAKQQATAIDNLSQYLPLAEQRLLVDVRNGYGLFSVHKVRTMLKEIYIESLKLYPGDDPIHVVKRLGANRKAPEVAGYTPILKEIREECISRRDFQL
ncbi:hypothetical protein HZB03_05345 [Candidatus Woesearchaeota archaeon]|nr:hypothetical protein [Candidatus Woesearchaeota archaeon]